MSKSNPTTPVSGTSKASAPAYRIPNIAPFPGPPPPPIQGPQVPPPAKRGSRNKRKEPESDEQWKTEMVNRMDTVESTVHTLDKDRTMYIVIFVNIIPNDFDTDPKKAFAGILGALKTPNQEIEELTKGLRNIFFLYQKNSKDRASPTNLHATFLFQEAAAKVLAMFKGVKNLKVANCPKFTYANRPFTTQEKKIRDASNKTRDLLVAKIGDTRTGKIVGHSLIFMDNKRMTINEAASKYL